MPSDIPHVIGFMAPVIDSKSGLAVSWRLQLLSSGHEGRIENIPVPNPSKPWILFLFECLCSDEETFWMLADVLR